MFKGKLSSDFDVPATVNPNHSSGAHQFLTVSKLVTPSQSAARQASPVTSHGSSFQGTATLQPDASLEQQSDFLNSSDLSACMHKKGSIVFRGTYLYVRYVLAETLDADSNLTSENVCRLRLIAPDGK